MTENIPSHKRHYSHLNSAAAILKQYKGDTPFAIFLRAFFAKNKKYGSKDRKQISHLCYGYFRLGKAVIALSVEERILLGMLVGTSALDEGWAALCAAHGVSKESLVPEEIFPWKAHLSATIDFTAFAASHLQQPKLFLRTRPGFHTRVVQKLTKANIALEEAGNTIALDNGTKIEELLHVNKEVVVQDASSQEIQAFYKQVKAMLAHRTGNIKAWDCCAASGGKSILLADTIENLVLLATDIRASIIANLKARFATAGMTKYKAQVMDAADIQTGEKFDLIIADVPCSGSGTWSRTPEQLFYFEEKKLQDFIKLQQSIIANIKDQLAPKGLLLYITCSVFRQENELQVAWLQQNGLELLESKIIKGYDHQADTMYAALLQRK